MNVLRGTGAFARSLRNVHIQIFCDDMWCVALEKCSRIHISGLSTVQEICRKPAWMRELTRKSNFMNVLRGTGAFLVVFEMYTFKYRSEERRVGKENKSRW